MYSRKSQFKFKSERFYAMYSRKSQFTSGSTDLGIQQVKVSYTSGFTTCCVGLHNSKLGTIHLHI